jgi:hypothetical protein
MDELSKKARELKNEYMRAHKANMSDEAKQAQRDYMKQWKKANKEKVKAYNVAYWERKAIESGFSFIAPVTAPVTAPVIVTAPVPIIGNTCVMCGKPFEGKRADSKYCSAACKMKHHREIKRNKLG